MTHTYIINGMTCGKCVARVKSALEKIDGIEKAEVTLEPQQAVITMKHHISTTILQKAVKEAGDYTITEDENVEHEMNQEAVIHTGGTIEQKSFFQTYKPILLVFAYLAGVTVLSGIYSGFSLMGTMSVFMGGFFLVFSFFKLLDLKGFAYSYMSYDIIAKKWLVWGYIYPFVELALGLAYLFHFEMQATNIATAVVMGVSSIGVIQSLLAKRQFQCACLGTVFNLPMSNITLTEDLLMTAMAVVMLII